MFISSLFYEFKLILTGWKKILAVTAALTFFSVSVYAAFSLAMKSSPLFAPFTVGIVDEDGAPEINLLISAFSNTKGIGGLVTLEVMSREQAESELNADEIPAYLIVPQGFTDSVITGTDMSLTLVGDETRPLQLTAAKLLMQAGMAFLTSSQAGIYSTYDYAAEQGMSYDDINQKLVMPINLVYAKNLLNYNRLFTTETVEPLDVGTPASYYAASVVSFLLILWLLAFTGTLSENLKSAVISRGRFFGLGLWKTLGLRFLTLLVFICVVTSPLAILFGAKYLAVSFFLACLTFLAALFRSEHAGGLFLFVLALFDVFVSGGVLPLAFLPKMFETAAVFTPTYWVIRLNSGAAPALALCGFGVFALALSALVTKRRCKA